MVNIPLVQLTELIISYAAGITLRLAGLAVAAVQNLNRPRFKALSAYGLPINEINQFVQQAESAANL